jgi:signal transduction histidine kinase
VPVELPDAPLSAEFRHHIYLACKEALNNVAKHAAATEVWVRLELGEKEFTLVIEDNGRGFDAAAKRERGNGLPNMAKRLEDIGGRCQMESSPGGGTRVRFVLLLPAARRKG